MPSTSNCDRRPVALLVAATSAVAMLTGFAAGSNFGLLPNNGRGGEIAVWWNAGYGADTVASTWSNGVASDPASPDFRHEHV